MSEEGEGERGDVWVLGEERTGLASGGEFATPPVEEDVGSGAGDGWGLNCQW